MGLKQMDYKFHLKFKKRKEISLKKFYFYKNCQTNE